MSKLMSFLGLEDEEVHEDEQYEEAYPSRKKKNTNNVLSVHSQKKVKVIVHEVLNYEETQKIADHLCSHRSVIVNLQRIDTFEARRVIDFLSGCIYGIRGNIKKIGEGIFLCTPENFEIEGSIEEFLGED